MSSDNDSDCESRTMPGMNRLGPCEVCGGAEAKFTCPKCEVKTCCLDCIRIHKKELDCDGIRDRTKFIRIKHFTEKDLLSDYRLLEECTRFVDAVKSDEKKKFTRIDTYLPNHLHKLKMACQKRGIVLLFLSQNFTRHKINTTRYNYKENIINWRIEWVFPNAELGPVKFVDEKCSEQSNMSELLDKYLNPNSTEIEGSKVLNFYRSAGFSGIKMLLRAEKVKGSANNFFEMDPSESLCENLTGKCIVEFPVIFIVLKDHAYNLNIITPDVEFHGKTNYDNRQLGNNENVHNKAVSNNSVRGDSIQEINSNRIQKRKRPMMLTEKIALEKKKEIEKEMKEEKKKHKNLLFTTGYSSEEDLVESDEEDHPELIKKIK